MQSGAETAPSKADHISVAVNDALVGAGKGRKPPGPPRGSNELSEPLIVGTMPAIPEAHTVRGGASGHKPPSRSHSRNRGTFDVEDAAAAPGPPVGSVAQRVMCVLLQLVLLGGYALLCLFLALTMIMSSYTIEEFDRQPELPPARWRFVKASAVLVGIIGTIVAGLCFLWGVATAAWPRKLPRPTWMRYTLGTAPALVHGVFVLMPFTIAVMETQDQYRSEWQERKLLL